LDKLAALHDSKKIVYSQLEFVDIAGIVKGASTGEGLGNKFLANIRECDAIVHVVRCFEVCVLRLWRSRDVKESAGFGIGLRGDKGVKCCTPR